MFGLRRTLVREAELLGCTSTNSEMAKHSEMARVLLLMLQGSNSKYLVPSLQEAQHPVEGHPSQAPCLDDQIKQNKGNINYTQRKSDYTQPVDAHNEKARL